MITAELCAARDRAVEEIVKLTATIEARITLAADSDVAPDVRLALLDQVRFGVRALTTILLANIQRAADPPLEQRTPTPHERMH